MYHELTGNLITLAKKGDFDVIAHGCNCHCSMGAGIAPQMAEEFSADKFPLESPLWAGDINKLGQIDYMWVDPSNKASRRRESTAEHTLAVVNAYTQYGFGKNHKDGKAIPLDYEALLLCMRKMNHVFKGKKIGLPQIGCGLAGGEWVIVKDIIKDELSHDCDVTVVIYDAPKPDFDETWNRQRSSSKTK